MAAEIKHTDILGQDINIGDIVVTAVGTRNLEVCKVLKLTPKMVSIQKMGTKRSSISKLRYPGDLCVIVNLPETYLYVLKNQ